MDARGSRRANEQVRWRSRLLLLLCGTIVALAGAELTLAMLGQPTLETRGSWRTKGFHRLDSDLIYSLRPDARSYWETEEFVEIASTNTLGLRGPEPRARELRILVLGDSMTFGHGVGNEETYPHALQDHLRARGLDVDVVNGGVKGYGIDQAYQLFSLRLRDLEPDLLLLAVNHNDVDDDADRPLFELHGNDLRPRDPTRDRLYRTTLLERAVPEVLVRSRVAALVVRFMVSRSSAPLVTFADHTSRVRWARKKARVLIGKLAAMARQDGFEFVIVTMPARDRAEAEYSWLESPPVGVTVLDLHADRAWRERSAEIFFPTDKHFTPRGNAWVAAEIGDFLLSSPGLRPEWSKGGGVVGSPLGR